MWFWNLILHKPQDYLKICKEIKGVQDICSVHHIYNHTSKIYLMNMKSLEL
jgi:hypothetical protein